MTDLSGKTILVVEDEYYVAADTARALRDAGARVLGPCAGEDDFLNAIANELPSAAIIDINLGNGADFSIAEILARREIPFVFMTGYDLEVIPKEFANVLRVQKPVGLADVVVTVSKLFADSD